MSTDRNKDRRTESDYERGFLDALDAAGESSGCGGNSWTLTPEDLVKVMRGEDPYGEDDDE